MHFIVYYVSSTVISSNGKNFCCLLQWQIWTDKINYKYKSLKISSISTFVDQTEITDKLDEKVPLGKYLLLFCQHTEKLVKRVATSLSFIALFCHELSKHKRWIISASTLLYSTIYLDYAEVLEARFHWASRMLFKSVSRSVFIISPIVICWVADGKIPDSVQIYSRTLPVMTWVLWGCIWKLHRPSFRLIMHLSYLGNGKSDFGNRVILRHYPFCAVDLQRVGENHGCLLLATFQPVSRDE